MQASWNQWGGTVGSSVPNFPSTFPSAVPPAVNTYPSLPVSNPFQVPAASTLNTVSVTSAVGNPFNTAAYGQPHVAQQQQTQQQQWQQWEQWQQQYAQWHQQYGDKYQGPMPTVGMVPNVGAASNFTSMPPLPQNAPVQPPPPESVPPPSEKSDESNKRTLQDAGGKEETKKQKTGKGKSENLEDLLEQEKTFDSQFKTWEASFLKWKEQNANHPDKAQYKEYEAKWESWREQLLQKREQLRKKREAKEVEAAAAAAAAKEAALATSSVSSVQQGYSSNVVSQSNPFVGSTMMYPMPNMYPSQDASTLPNQAAASYMSNYPMYNMPPPSVPQMPCLPTVGASLDSQQNMQKLNDLSKPTQSLEFLSSSSSNAKSIPGLDLVSADKNLNPAFMSNIASNSSLFSYSQDITKPLHTSDDKPFNFPTPSQPNYSNRNQPSQYSSFQRNPTSSSLGDSYSHFQNSSRFPPFDKGNANQMDRDKLLDDRFGRPGFNRNTDSRFGNDCRFRPNLDNDYRNDQSDKGSNKFSSSFTPNFSSDKFAKYLEDEYDDSRFRDPEPNESPQYNNQSKFGAREENRNHFSNYRQNFSRSDNSFNRNNDSFKRDFNDRGNRNNFERQRPDFKDNRQPFERTNKPDNRFDSFNRDSRFSNRITGPPFSRTGPNENKDNYGRSDFGPRGSNCEISPSRVGKFEVLDKETGRPVSLLDLPPMKPPDAFDKQKSFADQAKAEPEVEEPSKTFPMRNSRFSVANEFDQNTYPEKDVIMGTVNSSMLDKPLTSSVVPEIARAEVMENYIPAKIFEYDHISRNNDTSALEPYEPIYVFDYAHGKRKSTRFSDELSKNVFEGSTIDDAGWEGESWDESETKRKEILTPLPPRNRNSVSDPTKEILEIFKEKPGKPDSFGFKDFGRKKDNFGSQTFRNFGEDKRPNDFKKDKDTFIKKEEEKPPVILVGDLLYPPGRHSRPLKLVIIMRGPPGSGKTYTARLIKDKEVEMGGSAPRILSLDDYFTVENDVEEKDPNTGKVIKKKEMQYEYDAALESSYQDSLLKSFKKTISDGFFPFIIVDCVNDKLKKYEEMYTFAKSKGFQVLVCEMDMDLTICSKRNVHNRSESEISKIISDWEKTPSAYPLLDVRSLLQSAAIAEVDMTDVSEEQTEKEEEKTDTTKVEETVETDAVKEKEDDSPVEKEEEKPGTEEETEEKTKSSETEEITSYMEVFCTSKWENMENTEEKLDRLDGISKKRSAGGTSFKDWLQLPEESESDLSWYTSAANAKGSGELSISRKKRVRWADLEERVAQQKMRAIGFVVGQTDWKRMMDPTCGGDKLTQTKYIYK